MPRLAAGVASDWEETSGWYDSKHIYHNLELTCTVYVGWLSCVVCFDQHPLLQAVLPHRKWFFKVFDQVYHSIPLHQLVSLSTIGGTEHENVRSQDRSEEEEEGSSDGDEPGWSNDRSGRPWGESHEVQLVWWQELDALYSKAFSFGIVLRCLLWLCQIVHHHPPVSFCTMSLRHLQLNYCRKMRV